MKFDLEFSVEGSEPEPYRVRLGTEQGRVVADCSCRFGRTQAGKLSLCKHRRAVLQGDAKLLGLPAAAVRSLNAWLARNQTGVDALLRRRTTPRVAGVPRALPQPSAPRLGTAACIDIETTGFSPQSDQITEVAVALFRFDQDTGRILGIVHLYSSVAEPTVPISPRISALTAISAQLAQGRVIDWATVKWAINQAEFLVAHNAEFERRFLSRIPGLLDGRELLCSQHLPTWHAPGVRSSVRLEDLAAARRIPHLAHRAFGDVQATVQLLGATSPITGAPYFAEVLRAARASLFPPPAPMGQGRPPARRRATSPIPT